MGKKKVTFVDFVDKNEELVEQYEQVLGEDLWSLPIQEIEDLLEMVLPKKHKYTPVYAVFAMIKEELGIY